MAKTSTDARRHIREWSELFRDSAEIAAYVVQKFIERHKKSKHLKQSLQRLKRRGLVKESNKKFILTQNGVFFFLRIRKKFISLADREKWDGKWRLISFDIPVKENNKRALFRALLKEFDFYFLQKSVWVCPNYLAEDFWKLVVYYDLDKYCKIMLVEIIEGDEDLKNYYKL